MENTIVYSLSIPLLFGIFCGYVNYFNCLYVSNTKLIIRQSEQIQFVLGRMIELENKIKSLKSHADLNEQVKDDELDKVLEEDLNEDEEDLNEEYAKEEVFELIETTLTPNAHENKKSSWLSFLF